MEYIIPHHDEFSVYTPIEEIIDYIDTLIESGIDDQLEIYDLCVEKFGKYVHYLLNSII